MYLMCASKKGFSAHQLHRMLGVTYKTAWFIAHRIREAMRSGSFRAPLGGEGKKVEADETFIGRKKGAKVKRGTAHKMAVLSLVQRGGEVRSFPINTTKAREIGPIVNKHIAKESDLARTSSLMASSPTAPVNTWTGRYIPIRSRAISQSSSAE